MTGCEYDMERSVTFLITIQCCKKSMDHPIRIISLIVKTARSITYEFTDSNEPIQELWG